MTKLYIKDIKQGLVYRPALHLEDGTLLPNQMTLEIKSDPREYSTVTVVFHLDDDKIRFLERKPVKRWKWAVRNSDGEWFIPDGHFAEHELDWLWGQNVRCKLLPTERVDYE